MTQTTETYKQRKRVQEKRIETEPPATKLDAEEIFNLTDEIIEGYEHKQQLESEKTQSFSLDDTIAEVRKELNERAATISAYRLSDEEIRNMVTDYLEKKTEIVDEPIMVEGILETNAANERTKMVKAVLQKHLVQKRSTLGLRKAFPLQEFFVQANTYLTKIAKRTGKVETCLEVKIDEPSFDTLESLQCYFQEKGITVCTDYEAKILFANESLEGEISNLIKKEKVLETFPFYSFGLGFLSLMGGLIELTISGNAYLLLGIPLAIASGIVESSFYKNNYNNSYGLEVALAPAKKEYSSEEVKQIKTLTNQLKEIKI